jgi:probable HAF family extracellular repeat protein
MRRFVLLVAGLALLADIAATVSGGATQAEARWVITDLGTLGGNNSRAVAINGRGQVIGSSRTRSDADHAVLWENGKMRDLGTFGGPGSEPTAINDKGQVIGSADTEVMGNEGNHPDYIPHAFIWQSGKMRDLGTLGGSGRSSVSGSGAWGVNERGQVVGLLGRSPARGERRHLRRARVRQRAVDVSLCASKLVSAALATTSLLRPCSGDGDSAAQL